MMFAHLRTVHGGSGSGQRLGSNFVIEFNLLSHFDYNQNNFRVTAHTTVNPQTLNYFQNLGYLYDNVGNITSIQDNLGGTAGRNFQYDDLNRLTYAEGPFGANQAVTSCSYQYSPIGNPDKYSYTFSYGDAMHPSAVTYNPATSKNYSYDTDGNMMTRGSPALTWDIDNRVTSISSQGGTTYMNYDDDGVRVEKNAPTGITLYPFSGVEIDPNGVMTKYIKIGGETFASKKGTNQYFYHNDHLGGINVITDISFTEVQRNEYDPWGSVSKAVGNIEATHRFTGQELDPETGLYYYGGRYYDPEISRFVSPDPFVPSPDDPQSLNRYSYTINNPQRYIDPSGYFGEDLVLESLGYVAPILAWAKFIKDMIDIFGPHHHPKPRRTSSSHPENKPPEPNWGGPLSDSVRVYVNNGYLQTGLGFVGEGEDSDRLPLIVWNETWWKVQGKRPGNKRILNTITCATVLPDRSTVGSHVSSIVNSLNNSARLSLMANTINPVPESQTDVHPISIMSRVYSGTNFRAMYGGPGADYAFLGDAGNFAYGAISANLGVPLWATEAVAGAYSLIYHPVADWGWPFFMDPSARTQIPAGYSGQCKR